MLHAARMKHILDALRAATQASTGEPELEARSAIIDTGVEQLLAEIAEAEGGGEDLPKKASDVLGLFEKIGMPEDDSALMGQVVLGLGKTYERMGNNPQAYESYKQALSLATKANDKALQAGCLRRMGRVLVRMARWSEATDHFNRGIAIYDAADDRQGRAEVLLDLGILHYQQGNLDAAEECYSEALEIAEEGDHLSLAVNARNNLGIVANVRGDTDRAIAHYQSCIPLAEQAGMETHLARANHNLGIAHAGRKNWSDAGEYYERALKLAQKHSIAETLSAVHLSRSHMYFALGDLDMAAVACGRALSIYNSSHHRLGEAEAYRVLGGVFAKRGEEITAVEMFKRSLEMAQEAPAPLEIAETYHAMGLAYELLGKTDNAVAALENAIGYFEQVQAESDLARARADIDRIRGSSP